ncbi:type II toxin-antitoxin system VapC family toxin [Brunnivagina elsteri]|uniref:PIN domain nuclease n=1 Tax=Brunnivagina elsteri CCALA 953 TaxID=987040 RepID=A0A2A2TBZ0_9CYAN|nr:PIN domain-containing protein [Calothrix elsteri]PAX51242.1 PIN domain nuclease [Calothrix elsteri CCALA 953]
MKVLLDTNIILDVALERQPFFDDSETILSFVEQGQIEGYICASSFGDLYYIIRKAKGRDLALEFLREIVTLCQPATVDRNTINMALSVNFRDFEDTIKYSTAVLNNFDAIITRNSRDFPVTTPRILTPQQLIQELTDSS